MGREKVPKILLNNQDILHIEDILNYIESCLHLMVTYADESNSEGFTDNYYDILISLQFLKQSTFIGQNE